MQQIWTVFQHNGPNHQWKGAKLWCLCGLRAAIETTVHSAIVGGPSHGGGGGSSSMIIVDDCVGLRSRRPERAADHSPCSKHGLYCNKMALITSGLLAPQARTSC